MEQQFVITEGRFDKELLERVLPEEVLRKTMIVEGRGSASALSLARSLYARGDTKVLIILDSDSFNEREIQEKKEFVENALKMLPSNSNLKVIIFIPEVDSLLFADKSFIESNFLKTLSEYEYELYKRDPKFAFVKLSGGDSANKVRFKLLDNLDENLKQKINDDIHIKEMIDYLK